MQLNHRSMQFNDRVIVKQDGQPDAHGRVICQLSGDMTIEWGPKGNAQVIVALDRQELVVVAPDAIAPLPDRPDWWHAMIPYNDEPK